MTDEREGFVEMNVSTSVLDDPKWRNLHRARPDLVAVAWTAYTGALAESWRSGRPVEVIEAWPTILRFEPEQAAEVRALLIGAGLLTSDGVIPTGVWDKWFGKASRGREKLRAKWRADKAKGRSTTESEEESATESTPSSTGGSAPNPSGQSGQSLSGQALLDATRPVREAYRALLGHRRPLSSTVDAFLTELAQEFGADLAVYGIRTYGSTAPAKGKALTWVRDNLRRDSHGNSRGTEPS